MKSQKKIYSLAANNWDLYGSPGRPSKNDIEIYENILKSLKPKKVLILGSTPELRDLVFKLGCNITCVDINEDMLHKMKRYMKKVNPDEKLIVSDWTDMPFSDDSFDAILGDIVLGNVEYTNQERFLKETKRVLKREGVFIQHIFFYKRFPEHDYETVFLRFSEMKPSRDSNAALFANMMYLTYNNKSKIFDSYNIYKVFEKYKGFHKNTKKMIHDLYTFWGNPMKKVWHIDSERETHKLISGHFDIEGFHYAKDYMFAELFPIISCMNKK